MVARKLRPLGIRTGSWVAALLVIPACVGGGAGGGSGIVGGDGSGVVGDDGSGTVEGDGSGTVEGDGSGTVGGDGSGTVGGDGAEFVGKIITVDDGAVPYRYHFYVPTSARDRPVVGIVHVGGGGPWESPHQEFELQSWSEPSGLIMLWVNFPERDDEASLDDQGWPDQPDHHNFKTALGEFFRPDLKFLEVLEHFRGTLEEKGFVVDRRIFVTGFSSGGMWANRFTMLHPPVVKAAAMGGAGLILMPVATYADGTTARFPYGIGDYEEPPGGDHPHGGIGVGPFDPAALREVSFFVFDGELDLGDDPIGLPEMPDQAVLYENQFGNRVQRGLALHQLLQQMGVDSTHRLYPNVGHEWTDQMKQDVIDFFLSFPLEAPP